MYTGTHLFLSSALRRRLGDEGRSAALFPERAHYLPGSVRPDRWSRTLFRNHQYTAHDRAIRLYNWLTDAHVPHPAGLVHHRLGIAMHYVEDAMDRSKKLSKSKQTLLRDLWHGVALGLMEIALAGGTPLFTATSQKPVFDALSDEPAGIDYRCLDEEDLTVSPDPERRFALSRSAFQKTLQDYAALGYWPLVRAAFEREDFMAGVDSSRRKAAASISSTGFQRSLRVNHQRVVYREVLPSGVEKPRFWLADGAPTPANVRYCLTFIAEDLGWILAFADALFSVA